MGAYKEFKRDLFWLVAIAWLVVLLGDVFSYKFDSTDGESRSGLGLYTDAMTGCQYLSAGMSGITPRLDRDGKQVCEARP